MNCPRCSVELTGTYTPKGIVVDYCRSCQGIWFDKGELNYYSKSPAEIRKYLDGGLINAKPSSINCPRCDVLMNEGGIVKDDILIDCCPDCRGVWLDPTELTQIMQAEIMKKGMDMSKFFGKNYRGANAMEELTAGAKTASGGAAGAFNSKMDLPTLPNLLFSSIGTFVVLYGMLGIIFIILAESGAMSKGAAVLSTIAAIFLNYLISPFIMDIFMRWLQNLNWVPVSELPQPLGEFIIQTCSNEKIPIPSIGIIDDGSPNAFTYGHTPYNARIVITRGLMEQLSPEEVNAVVAHEIGHVVHWDILLMTMASMVPILLYYISRRLMESGSGDNKNLAAIGVVAYIFYVIAEYAVLFLSRTREYWADRYAAEATKNPNALSRALIKVAYGLASGAERSDRAAVSAGETVSARRGGALNSLGALGIFDSVGAKNLVATSARTLDKKFTNDMDSEEMKGNIMGAMQWDLWNPWAIYYQLHSTHPLPALRIDALSKTALTYDQVPYIIFDREKPESYWDDFLVDLIVSYLPMIGLMAGAAISAKAHVNPFAFPAILYGVGYLAMLFFSYPQNDFPEHSVASLLKYVKVSGVRSIPATIKGRIIGRGIPGLIYSEDLVVQDNTGYIFMDYEQPLAIFNFFFGLKNERFIGTEVRAIGWYRRAPVPYFELSHLDTFEGRSTCYAPLYKKIFAFGAIAVGIYLMIAG